MPAKEKKSVKRVNNVTRWNSQLVVLQSLKDHEEVNAAPTIIQLRG